MNYRLRLLSVLLIAGVGSACVGPAPIEDYALARAAIDAAQRSGAAKSAPGLYGQAEESYKSAQNALKEREPDEARELFIRARTLAEKAENATRLKKFETGE